MKVITILNAKAVLIVLNKPIGYVHELQANGIEDPISVFGEEVQKLNQEYKKKEQSEKERQISEESPEKLLGYFPLKNLNDSLGCKKYLDLMQTATNFRFNIFDMMAALIYARVVCPCSKLKNLFRGHPPSCLKDTTSPLTRSIPVSDILVLNMKRSLRSSIIK